jgi:hypothetical protein
MNQLFNWFPVYLSPDFLRQFYPFTFWRKIMTYFLIGFSVIGFVFMYLLIDFTIRQSTHHKRRKQAVEDARKLREKTRELFNRDKHH